MFVTKMSVVVAAVAVAGCGGDGSSLPSSLRSAVPSGSTMGSISSADTLAISGTPAGAAVVGMPYSFQPTVTDEQSAKLTFSVSNKPAWAAFDSSTGRLSGTPSAVDVGDDGGIVISVTDGSSKAALAQFAITVSQAATGAVTLSWTPPTSNTNGTALTNLAGYQINYGTSASALTQTVNVAGVGVTNYVVDNLTPGTWYFSVSAYNSSGVQSTPSAVVAIAVVNESLQAPHRF